VAHDTRGKKFFAFTPFITLRNGSLAIKMQHLQKYSILKIIDNKQKIQNPYRNISSRFSTRIGGHIVLFA